MISISAKANSKAQLWAMIKQLRIHGKWVKCCDKAYHSRLIDWIVCPCMNVVKGRNPVHRSTESTEATLLASVVAAAQGYKY